MSTVQANRLESVTGGNPQVEYGGEDLLAEYALREALLNSFILSGLTFRKAWATAIVYALGDVVVESAKGYKCISAHTSGVFATDLAAGRWEELTGANGPELDSFFTQLRYGLAAYLTASGTDTYSAAPSPALTAYTTGETFSVHFANANTVVNPTLNLNGLGAKDLVDISGTALAVGQINGQHIVRYDGTNMVVLNPNPTAGAGATNLAVDTFLQDVGNGADGPFSSIGASTISKVLSQYTTFALNIGHTITIDTPWAIIKATNSITIDGTINMRGVDIIAVRGFSADTPCNSAGAGGGGAGGADSSGNYSDSNGADGQNTQAAKFVSGGTGGAGGTGGFGTSANGSNGSAGAAMTTEDKTLLRHILGTLLNAYVSSGDGGTGGGGYDINGIYEAGGAGGTGGKSGGLLILIAPVITISSSGAVDISGQDGGTGASGVGSAGGGGGGGGGAGGALFLVAPAVTNAGTMTFAGGAGGAGGNIGSGVRVGGTGGAGADGYVLTIDPTA